jgi:hypothetical protein
MISCHNWRSVARFEALIPYRLDGLIDVRLTDLDPLELLILQVQCVNGVNNIGRFKCRVHDPPEILFSIVSPVLCLVTVHAEGRLANTGVLGVLLVDGDGSCLPVSLSI